MSPLLNERVFHVAAARFEAARQISGETTDHRSRRLHGHGFRAGVRAVIPQEWGGFPGAEVDALRDMLVRCVEPLNYRFLNETLPQPTDVNLARWVRSQLGVPGVEQVGIQSTCDGGVDLDRHDGAHLWRRYVFESAHRLPNVPPGHKCGRMHGHGFAVILHANVGQGGPDGTADFDRLDAAWAPLHAEIHQACLNDIPGLENPTSELIGSWIWRRLKPALPELSWVTVYETATCGAHFDGTRYRIWKELSLDSSLRLRRAPDGDPRRRIHGHTFTLRLHLNAPLDTVHGWTIDFGDVKELFTPVFRELDHQPLHEIADLEDNDAASLARWVRRRTAPMLPALDRVDVYETRGCGAILSWGADEPALPV